MLTLIKYLELSIQKSQTNTDKQSLVCKEMDQNTMQLC